MSEIGISSDKIKSIDELIELYTTKKITSDDLRNIFEMLPEEIVVVDLSGHVLFSNSLANTLITHISINGKLKNEIADLIYSDNEVKEIHISNSDNVANLPEHNYSCFVKPFSADCCNSDAKVLVFSRYDDIREKSEMFERVFSLSTNAMIISHWDSKRIYDVNNAFERITGLKSSDLKGKTFVESGLFNNEIFFEKVLESLISDGVIHNYPVCMIGNDKRIIYGSFGSYVIHTGGAKKILTLFTDLTNQVQAEDAVRASEQKYEYLINNLKEIVFQTDAKGHWTLLNHAWEEILGYTIDESLGQVFNSYVLDEDREMNNGDYAALMNGEKTHSKHNVRYIAKDGRIKWMEVYARLILDDSGIPLGSTGTLNDVTDKIIAMDEIKKSHANMKAILENIPYLAWLKDVDSNFILVNSSFCNLFNISFDEIIGKNDYYISDREVAEKFILDDLEIMKSGKQNLIEEKIVSDDGVRWSETYKTPVLDNDGNVIGTTGLSRDITERKQIEERLRELNRLHTLLTDLSSKLVQAPVEQIAAGIDYTLRKLGEYADVGRVYVFEFNNITESMNNTFEWCAEGVSHEIGNLQCVPMDLIPRWVKAFKKNEFIYIPRVSDLSDENRGEREILESQSIVSLLTIPMYIGFDLVGFIGFDSVKKEREWEADHITLLRIAGEIIAGTLFRKKFETEMIAARHAAEQANMAKSEFIANMSHEIRTPMNAVLGFSEILLNKIDDPKLKGFVNTILTSGQTLLSIINDILDLSKIEAGKMDIMAEPVNIQLLLQEVCNIFMQKVEEKNLELELSLSPTLPLGLMLDEVRLRQMLFNILGNAVKFTEKGGISVLAKATSNGNETINLEIQVIDTGIGIPEENRETIFESFSQVYSSSTRKYGGTGLGLAITKRLATMMGGEILLESSLGVGSTFTIYIKNIIISNEGLGETVDQAIDYSKIDFNGAKLLVVDDIQHNRDLIRSYVENNNIEFFEAESGDVSLSIAAQIMPDFILMDLRMPGISGYEATESIRKIEGLENVPIIAFTASSMKNEDDLINKTFAGYLRKPINRADLFGYLSYILDKKVLDVDFETTCDHGDAYVENYDVESLKNNQLLITKVMPIIDSHRGFWDHDSIVAVSACLDEVYADTKNSLARKIGENIERCLINFDFEPIEGIMNELKLIIEQ